MFFQTKLAFMAIAALLVMASAVLAGPIDPATLQIGPPVPPPGGDPNQIGSSGLVDIYQNSGGSSATLANPVLLILAIPNVKNPGNFFGSGNSINPVASVTYNGSTIGHATLGGTAYGYTGQFLAGKLTSTNPLPQNDVYALLTKPVPPTTIGGLQSPTDHSNNFANLSGADLTINHITANNFAIYVFDLTSTGKLTAKSTIAVQFNSGTIPTGTFAIAYGQSTDGSLIYDTPFTEAGLITGPTPSVPAPPAAFLFGVGGLAIVAWQLRRFRIQPAVV